MKKNIIAAIVAFAITTTAFAKEDRMAYLISRVPDATATCKDYLRTAAYDPTSIKFIENSEDYRFGTGFFRNDIWITYKAWVRNQFGAVLIHQFYCRTQCKKDSGCSVLSLDSD
jgi:hypothetical protein